MKKTTNDELSFKLMVWNILLQEFGFGSKTQKYFTTHFVALV